MLGLIELAIWQAWHSPRRSICTNSSSSRIQQLRQTVLLVLKSYPDASSLLQLVRREIGSSILDVFSTEDGKISALVSVMKQRLRMDGSYSPAFSNDIIQRLWMISFIANFKHRLYSFCFPINQPSIGTPPSCEVVDELLGIQVLDSYSPMHEIMSRVRDRLLAVGADIAMKRMIEEQRGVSSSSNVCSISPTRASKSKSQQQKKKKAHAKAMKKLQAHAPASTTTATSSLSTQCIVTEDKLSKRNMQFATSISPKDVTAELIRSTQSIVDVRQTVQEIVEAALDLCAHNISLLPTKPVHLPVPPLTHLLEGRVATDVAPNMSPLGISGGEALSARIVEAEQVHVESGEDHTSIDKMYNPRAADIGVCMEDPSQQLSQETESVDCNPSETASLAPSLQDDDPSVASVGMGYEQQFTLWSNPFTRQSFYYAGHVRDQRQVESMRPHPPLFMNEWPQLAPGPLLDTGGGMYDYSTTDVRGSQSVSMDWLGWWSPTADNNSGGLGGKEPWSIRDDHYSNTVRRHYTDRSWYADGSGSYESAAYGSQADNESVLYQTYADMELRALALIEPFTLADDEGYSDMRDGMDADWLKMGNLRDLESNSDKSLDVDHKVDLKDQTARPPQEEDHAAGKQLDFVTKHSSLSTEPGTIDATPDLRPCSPLAGSQTIGRSSILSPSDSDVSDSRGPSTVPLSRKQSRVEPREAIPSCHSSNPQTPSSDVLCVVLSCACLRAQCEVAVLLNQLAVQRSLIGALESSISGQLQPFLYSRESHAMMSGLTYPSLEVMSDEGDSTYGQPFVRRAGRQGQVQGQGRMEGVAGTASSYGITRPSSTTPVAVPVPQRRSQMRAAVLELLPGEKRVRCLFNPQPPTGRPPSVLLGKIL